jgi:hypothetical protein
MVVAELHCRAAFQDKDTRYLTALWQAPIVVTTAGEPHEKWTALYSLSDKCRIAGGQNSSKKRTEILL